MGRKFQQFCPFSKAEDNGDGTYTVTGVASSEATDAAGEIILADAIRGALPDFFRHGTGALREMHQLSAAGTVDEAEVDGDTNKTIISATVVDPLAIKKIETKTYKGFSIGGKVLKRNSDNRKIIEQISLSEISLVDRPCNPDAVFDMWKADADGADDSDDADDIGLEGGNPETLEDGAEKANVAETTMTVQSTDEGQAQVEKSDSVPAPINPSKVDVTGDKPSDGTSANQPVAGSHVSVTLPGGSNATATEVKNPEEAGQATPAPLNASETPTVEHVAPAKPKPGKDQRTRKDAAAPAEAVSSEAADAASGAAEEAVEKTTEVDPLTAARDAAAAAMKAATAVLDRLSKRAPGATPAALVVGFDLRKGLSATGRLGYLVMELAYALADAQWEKEFEGDESSVPAKLHDALKTLAAAYKAMSDEELQELLDAADKNMGVNIALAAAGGDLQKALDDVGLGDALLKLADGGEDLAKANGRIADLEAVNSDLLKTTGGLTEMLETLSKKVADLEEQPLAPKTVASGELPAGVQPVSKVEDTIGKAVQTAAPGAAGMTEEDVKKALDSLSPEARSELLLKAALHPSRAHAITR